MKLWEVMTSPEPERTAPVEMDRARAEWLVNLGAVYVNKLRVTDPESVINAGDLVRVHLNPRRYDVDKTELRRRVIAETDDYLVVNKPTGIPMHATLDNLRENLISSFEFPLFVTHRLDVPTSGLVLLAKSKRYQSLFNGVVARREIKKIYQVFTDKPVREGLLRHFMVVSDRAPKVVTSAEKRQSDVKYEECLLNVDGFQKLEENLFEARVRLLTGRTHQIRAQFAFEGAPIYGDELYGGRPSGFFGLHAAALEFKCPIKGETVSFTCWLPHRPAPLR